MLSLRQSTPKLSTSVSSHCRR